MNTMQINGWNVTGTNNQRMIIRDAFERIKFPFDRLTLPGTPELGWRDLNPGVALAVSFNDTQAVQAEEHRAHGAHNHGDKPHAIEVVLADGRRFTLGVIYTMSGRIYLDVRLERHPEMAAATLGAEVAHAVDFFLPMTDDQRNELLRLWGVGGTWWEVQDYGREYYQLGGEAFMGEFVKSYSDIPFDQASFLHDAGVEPEDVRRILGIQRTDYVEPLPEPKPAPPVADEPRPLKHFPGGADIYHRAGHYGLSRGVPLDSIEGFRPCKVCKP